MKEHQANPALVVADGRQLSKDDWVSELRQTVVAWFRTSGRVFPWRQSSDSFHLLVAEVLLRRTQAQRVAGPYVELIGRYPRAQDMANADLPCLRLWFRPLGLVGRADLLVDAAKSIVEQHGGEVPRDLGEIERLPGLGTYSARAVHCQAHGGSVPMVDESSGRLLRRLLGLSSPGPAYSDRELLRHAEALVPYEESKAFNLGLLDIAAAYCHVSSPSCVDCPLISLCGQGRRLAVNGPTARVSVVAEISGLDGRARPTSVVPEKVPRQTCIGRGVES